MRAISIILAASLSAALIPSIGWSAEDACAALARRDVGRAQVIAAEMTPPNWTFNARDYSVTVDYPVCRVTVRIEQTIHAELWMPSPDRWNARLLGAGVGGSAGVVNYRGLARGVNRGFAAVSTDTGHSVEQKDWMLDGRAADNYAHRGVHLMTEAAKSIVAQYYGAPAHKAYFMGCSGGGRQGLKEIERYPADYDGVLAGAPGANMPLLSVRHMEVALTQQQAAVTLDARDWQILARRVTQACDAIDGVRDGVIEDPRRCSFDLASIECSSAQTASCLSPEKVSLIRSIAGPLRDEHGQVLDRGLLPGVTARPGPPPSMLLELFGQAVHHETSWDPQKFVPSQDLAAVYRELPELRADEANLQAFRSLGHKAILYQGWMDPSVLAQSTIDFYDAVVAATGSLKRTQQYMRLFMVPGMLHCGGGVGADQFGGEAGSVALDADHDALSALVRWVETDRAPETLIAARSIDGTVVRTHPLCAYPEVAKYEGSGDVGDARNFVCAASGRASMP